ncbi:peptide methionine sulfoxide reductase family protein [Striga asiatica]|uniref:Peptide methionine sulfoxide reductase family protein n=1 Tax=Striga asiatica TaxID=4170 RepID=A0A5A7RLL9_STRAF|nr:peptide methionine sulfoxide reductase family protein [Striga asiatica]
MVSWSSKQMESEISPTHPLAKRSFEFWSRPSPARRMMSMMSRVSSSQTMPDISQTLVPTHAEEMAPPMDSRRAVIAARSLEALMKTSRRISDVFPSGPGLLGEFKGCKGESSFKELEATVSVLFSVIGSVEKGTTWFLAIRLLGEL